jgi:hypothetical protein
VRDISENTAIRTFHSTEETMTQPLVSVALWNRSYKIVNIIDRDRNKKIL